MPYTPRDIVARLNRARLTFVAMHRGDVPIGTYRKILKQAKLTDEQFKRL